VIRRTSHTLWPNPRRVLAKPYLPGQEIAPGGPLRATTLLERILEIPEPEVGSVLEAVRRGFSERHRDFDGILESHFDLVAHHLPPGASPSHERRHLIGAYFTHEYSVEAAALLNPSMVLAPDQTGIGQDERRFVMSLRAVGEGHISSIEFRTGVLGGANEVTFDALGSKLVGGLRTPPDRYDKREFAAKLTELGAWNDIARGVLGRLSERFTPEDLDRALVHLQEEGTPHAVRYETEKIIRVLSASSYVTRFPADSEISERVIFPAGPNETHGMEDARFVRFVEDDGTARYYATYTAFDGFEILPQLIETQDFASFTISTLNGAAAYNKGMALFPRRIRGEYVMLSRRDRENLHVARSADIRFWDDLTEIYRPTSPWELLHIGNCGSPIETAEGWLVLTHGVGPMRRYALGAILLDLDDPRRVIGRLPVPLLEPDETEREGYVPNVLYSCGSLAHGDSLVLPYGFSDVGIRIAIVSLQELLARLRGG